MSKSKTLDEYIAKDMKRVKRIWKKLAISMIIIELISLGVLAWRYKGTDELGIHYFNFGEKVVLIGVA